MNAEVTAIDLSLAACRERYLANLEALYSADAALAMQMDAAPFADCPLLEPTPDGAATTRIESDDNQLIYVHSRRRPLAEAASLIAAQAASRSAISGAARVEPARVTEYGDPCHPPEADDADDDSDATFVLCGSGLGYHILACARLKRAPLVIVFEPHVPLVKAALCVCDFSALLRSGRLVFLTEFSPQTLRAKFDRRATSLMLGTRLLTLPHAQRCQAARQREFRAVLADLVTYARTQFVTLLRNSQITFRNIANNLRHYVMNPGVEVLGGRGAGFPAIVVGAGPSLARYLPLLSQVQDRAVIIAVQTVYGPLRRYGIEPHFVTSLDYHEISKSYFDDAAPRIRKEGSFQGLKPLAIPRRRGPLHAGTEARSTMREAILVAEPKVTWHVPDAFPGRKHLLRSTVAEELLRGCHVPRGALPAGSTVAHLAFYLAEHLGCDPIIFVGLDLAFSDGLYYAPGMPIEAMWEVECGRFQTIEMKQWERVARMRPILRQVPDLHGRPIFTDETFFTYIHQFAADIARSRARVINAGERGARLGNAETMEFAEAVERFCFEYGRAGYRLTVPPGVPPAEHGQAEYRLSVPPSVPPSIEELNRGEEPLRCARAALAARIEELAEVRRLARETRDRIGELMELLDHPAEFNRVVAQVDALRVEMERHERIYRLVVSVSPIGELRRIQADRAFEADEESVDDPATARRRLRRDQRFVDDFLTGCEFLAKTLEEASGRLADEAAP